MAKHAQLTQDGEIIGWYWSAASMQDKPVFSRNKYSVAAIAERIQSERPDHVVAHHG